MRFHVLDDSRLFIDLAAGGVLKAVAHSPTLHVAPEALSLEFAENDAAVHVRFRADTIEVPASMSASDREKMRDNLRGPDVLDARRHPILEFRGRYRGGLERGTLEGDVVVRGVVSPLSMPIEVTRHADVLVASGSWQGKQTGLGLRPYRALLGAIKLEDWLRLRVDVRLAER